MNGKSLAIAVASVFVVAGLMGGMVTAKGPADNKGNGGFDEYGYNYKARLYNGWYGHYDRDTTGGTGDAWLTMKWSRDWTPQADEPVGAWCTNHITWYSNDYNEDTWYGWTSRVPWNEDTEPNADYKITEFVKIMKVSNDEDAWEEYEDGGAYGVWGATYDNGVPKYVVFQDTVTVYDTETGDKVACYNLCETAPKGLGHPIF